MGSRVALYSDRHGIFSVEQNRPPTLAEQLAGKPSLTQVGRALDELGIDWIGARSPQAKGRVERLWGTLQDRLVSELRRRGVATLEDANAVLACVPAPPHRTGPDVGPGSTGGRCRVRRAAEGLSCTACPGLVHSQPSAASVCRGSASPCRAPHRRGESAS